MRWLRYIEYLHCICKFIEYLPPQLCVEVLRKELATEGFEYIDGKILPPTKPGLGIDLNKDAIKKYQVK